MLSGLMEYFEEENLVVKEKYFLKILVKISAYSCFLSDTITLLSRHGADPPNRDMSAKNASFFRAPFIGSCLLHFTVKRKASDINVR